MPEILPGSQWKHRFLNDNVKGPTQAPNRFTVHKVSDNEIAVVQATMEDQDPTFWDRISFLDTFEPLTPPAS